MKTTKFLIIIILAALISLSAKAQVGKDKKDIILRVKVFLEGKPVSSVLVDNTTVKITEMINNGSDIFKVTNGKIRIKLERDRHYVFHISNNGFETGYFVFSTVGVNTGNKYLFNIYVMLKKKKSEDTGTNNKLAYVKYDYLEKDRFVISEHGAEVQYLKMR